MITKKSIKFIAVSLIASSSLFAQKQLQLEAFVTKNDGTKLSERLIFVEKISGGKLWYRIKKNDVKINNINTSKLRSVYISRPDDYIKAIELFENRKYVAALKEFKALQTKYDNFSGFNDSVPVLAGLYELKCLLKLKQYDQLAEAKTAFAKNFSNGKYITSPTEKAQLEIYDLWINLQNSENYPKIKEQYETKWKTVKLPNYLRAQVEFIYGKVLESEGEDTYAIIAYSKAMNADFAGSEVITLEALGASLNLITKDEEVKAIRNLWDKREKALMRTKINTAPYLRLLEASALVRVHNKLGLSGIDSIGKAIPLEDKFASYAKYTREDAQKFLK